MKQPPTKTTAQQSDSNNNESLEQIRVKIISLGDQEVGKSRLVKKYCEPARFNSTYVPTIGVDYGVKATSKKMNDGRMLDIKLDFFDLSGGEIMKGGMYADVQMKNNLIICSRHYIPQAIRTTMRSVTSSIKMLTVYSFCMTSRANKALIR